MAATDAKPAYQLTAAYASSAGMMCDGCSPMLQQIGIGSDDYFHKCVWAACPLDKVMAECVNSWNAYQEEWKAQGYDHPYVPYPYTMDTIKEWMTEYEDKVGPLN